LDDFPRPYLTDFKISQLLLVLSHGQGSFEPGYSSIEGLLVETIRKNCFFH